MSTGLAGGRGRSSAAWSGGCPLLAGAVPAPPSPHGDRSTPIEETMRALDDLVSAGKIRYIGFSNVPAWVTAQAQTLAILKSWTPVIGLQVEYSLLARTVEGEIAPLVVDQGMSLVAWSPLKNGLLSGKYGRGTNGRRKPGFRSEGPTAGMGLLLL